MLRIIPKEQVIQRIRFENPWWESGQIDEFFGRLTRRPYFDLFMPLVRQRDPNRAVVLMGPRRVGKTVLLYQAVQELIDAGIDRRRICFVSVEHPIYNGRGLEELVTICREAVGAADPRGLYVFFDEIQYLRDWEVHLKSLVDSYRDTKFVASGSAAAALRLKSLESGAGRFTDFFLPPLTFHEYLLLLGARDLVSDDGARDIEKLNAHFLDYLNYGGYPEVMFSDAIKADPGRHIRNDIVDKVLLRDLPSLYGIDDVQELNSLFTTLAYQTANEVSYEDLAKRSGVAKNTLRRYVEYLEAAFLLRRVERIDRNAKRFQRATSFKVYLTNPSIRAALFAPISRDDGDIGDVVETAVFAQMFHREGPLHYARWKEGEVDVVVLNAKDLKPELALEVKWSDRIVDHLGDLSALVAFARTHGLDRVHVTTISRSAQRLSGGVTVQFDPAALYSFWAGEAFVNQRRPLVTP